MSSAILGVVPLGFPWQTVDPFLFCAHHRDAYPRGNPDLGPAASLAGRNLGMDFEVRDGFRMYHGRTVPGFPQHPHRGFETITLVRTGFCDHSDSLGAQARFGNGDVQWMTAGKGIVHAEMFPLLRSDEPNPLELFQIWLNLPRRSKLVSPHFEMLWGHTIPRHRFEDASGRAVEVVTVAGALGSAVPSPPPNSWAADPANEVAVWTIDLAPDARWTLPPASAGLTRVLYFFSGPALKAGGRDIEPYSGVQLAPDAAVELVNGPEASQLLLLQGRPIGEPVVQHGPFVMNTASEIHQAFADYRETGFGGWPWPADDPVHGAQRGRFAVHLDGQLDEPPDGQVG